MPIIIPAPGSWPLPRISTRAFQLIDAGYDVWGALRTAIEEYLFALSVFFGNQLVEDIGTIGV